MLDKCNDVIFLNEIIHNSWTVCLLCHFCCYTNFNIYHMFRSSSHFLNHLLVSYRCTPNLSSNPIMGLQVFHPLHYTDQWMQRENYKDIWFVTRRVWIKQKEDCSMRKVKTMLFLLIKYKQDKFSIPKDCM